MSDFSRIAVEFVLNLMAQGGIPMARGLEWLDTLNDEHSLAVMRTLGLMVGQAHPRWNEVEPAVLASRLKPTFTPVVLLKRYVYGQRFEPWLHKIVTLPRNERRKSFVLLMCLFVIAARRRRQTDCHDGCSHWWHLDLGDEAVLTEHWVNIWGASTEADVADARALGRELAGERPLRGPAA